MDNIIYLCINLLPFTYLCKSNSLLDYGNKEIKKMKKMKKMKKIKKMKKLKKNEEDEENEV